MGKTFRKNKYNSSFDKKSGRANSKRREELYDEEQKEFERVKKQILNK